MLYVNFSDQRRNVAAFMHVESVFNQNKLDTKDKEHIFLP